MLQGKRPTFKNLIFSSSSTGISTTHIPHRYKHASDDTYAASETLMLTMLRLWPIFAKNKKHMNKKIILSAVLSTMLLSCKEQAVRQDKRQCVAAATAESTEGTSPRKYTFISKPYRTTLLAFKVGGQVTQLNVQSGQFFRKGQIIAALDPRDFILHKQQAAAICSQAKAEYERTKRLFHMNNLPESDYERAHANYTEARTNYEMAANRLDDTRLVAPFDGYIQVSHIERYQDITPGQPIVTFIDLSRIKIETYVPEDLAMELQKNNTTSTYKISFDHIYEKKFIPSTTYITQTATDNNLSFKLTALLDNNNNNLPGGMSGNIYISLPSKSITDTHTTVPQTAICNNANVGNYVWVIGESGRISRRNVSTGKLLSNGRIEITNGLSAGERVAITHQSFLSEGDTVNIESRKYKK